MNICENITFSESTSSFSDQDFKLSVNNMYILFSEFFIRLDQECGPLTLHSSLKDLVTYTRRSLEAIEHSRGQSSAEMMLGPVPGDSESFR